MTIYLTIYPPNRKDLTFQRSWKFIYNSEMQESQDVTLAQTEWVIITIHSPNREQYCHHINNNQNPETLQEDYYHLYIVKHSNNRLTHQDPTCYQGHHKNKHRHPIIFSAGFNIITNNKPQMWVNNDQATLLLKHIPPAVESWGNISPWTPHTCWTSMAWTKDSTGILQSTSSIYTIPTTSTSNNQRSPTITLHLHQPQPFLLPQTTT